MKWPWVSRAEHDRAISFWKDFAADIAKRNEADLKAKDAEYANALRWFEARLNGEEKAFADLLAKYHELKVQGAARPEPVTALPKVQPDPVTQAVIAMSRGQAGLRKHYAEHVARRRAEGVEDDAIAKEILAGVEDDMGVPG